VKVCRTWNEDGQNTVAMKQNEEVIITITTRFGTKHTSHLRSVNPFAYYSFLIYSPELVFSFEHG
jgi:hypothetical protein